MSDQHAAGWYPAPDRPGEQRYFDGTMWTDHYTPGAGAAATQPVAPTSQAAAPTYEAPAQPYQAPPPQKKGGAAKVLIPVLACLGLAVIVGVIAVAAGSGGDDPDPPITTDDPPTPTDDPPTPTDDPPTPTDDPPTPTDATTVPGEPVAVSGFTKYEALGETWVSVGIALTGLSGGSQELTISLLDADGTPIATNTEYLGSDRDGGEVLVSSSFTTDTPTVASVRVDVTNASSFSDETPFPVTVASDEFDGFFWTVKGTATNDRSENIEFGTITCVAFKAGEPIAGVSTVTDTMVPGAEIAFEASNTFDPQADEVRCQGEAA